MIAQVRNLAARSLRVRAAFEEELVSLRLLRGKRHGSATGFVLSSFTFHVGCGGRFVFIEKLEEGRLCFGT